MSVKTKALTKDKLLCSLLVLGSCIFLYFIFYALAEQRLIGGDEGFYVMAGKLVGQGKVPYLDFFYPQSPLYPYLLSLWYKLDSVSWLAARHFSSFCALLTGVFLMGYLWKVTGRGYAIGACIVFGTSGLILTQFSFAKPYALSGLFLLLGFICLEFAADKDRKFNSQRYLCLSGLGIGFAACTRLPLGIVLLAALATLGFQKAERKSYLALLVGFIIGIAPLLVLSLCDIELSYINNIGYHLDRSFLSEDALAQHRLKVLEILFGFQSTQKFDFFEFPYLLCLSLISAAYSFKTYKRLNNAFVWAFSLFVVHILPSPTYVEYFCLVEIFLIIEVTLFCAHVAGVANRFGAVAVHAVVFCCLIVSVLNISNVFRQYASSGTGVLGVNQESVEAKRLANIQELAVKVDKLTNPGESVIALWPGSLLETHVQPYPGTENHFAAQYAKIQKLSKEKIEKYRLLTVEGMKAAIQVQKVKLVVLNPSTNRHPLESTLQVWGFVLQPEIQGYRLYLHN